MSKIWLLKIHRWTTLVFAIPLAALIVTGLVLSFEPMVAGSSAGGLVTPDSIAAALARHDPQGKARSLIVRGYDGSLSIGAQPGSFLHVDIARNEAIGSPGLMAQIFTTSRRLHETFLLDLGWLVTVSTIALMALIALGVLMGWPQLRNTLAGWHKGTGWVLLPLVILSPLTGLFLAYGITLGSTLGSPPAAPGNTPVSLRDAVRIVGASHDLGRVTWIRPMGGALRARVNDGGEMRVFTVTAGGLVPATRNWPRLIHEGNWGGNLSALVNVVTSLAFVLLLSTGLVIWGRRTFRRRRPRAATPAFSKS
jgi:uncharacterized iron-regulated membrane protein